MHPTTISADGIALIKRFEGLHKVQSDGTVSSYRCPAGKWTVGWGSCKGVRSGMKITVAEAEDRLAADISEHEHFVKQYVTVPLTQGQYDSLVSFVFNLGGGAFRSSTLLSKLNKGLYDDVPEQLMRWNKARVNGQLTPLKGLTRRRAAEAAIFSKDAKLPSDEGGPIAPQKVTASTTKPLRKSKTMAGAGIALPQDAIDSVNNPALAVLVGENMQIGAAAFSPKREDYPAYMAPDPENFRGLHAVRVLTGANDLTLDSLLDIAYDPYLPGFEKLIPGLVDAYGRSASDWPALAEPVRILRDWNLQVSADSVAMTLAHFYGVSYSDKAAGLRDAYDMGKIDLINYLGTDTPDEERLQVFAETVAMLKTDFGQWNTPWGEVNRYQRINGDIRQAFNDDVSSLPVGMASGNWGALASFGARRYPGTKRIYGTSGNSFIAIVEFGDKVSAISMLAGGQSGDPDSPHFDDQAQAYVDREFKDVAYYRADVERRAERTYHPGTEKF